MRNLIVGFLLVASAALSGCGYNRIQNQDEAVKSAWSEVLNQYQRRADLVPNLVATVKGFAAQEERVLVEVTQARAKVGSIQLTPELINDPAAFAKFQAAQGELTVFHHRGFWQAMDTLRERIELEALWDSGSAPWCSW